MSTEREDLELQLQWLELKEAYVAAKALGRDSDEYKTTKAAMSEFRTHWRGIRDFLGAEPPADGDATATPATVGLTSAIQGG